MIKKIKSVLAIAHLFFGCGCFFLLTACSNSGDSNSENDVKEGEQLHYYSNGQIMMQLYYENGKKVGEQFVYYDNGQLKKEECFKNGERNGECLYYHENGQLKSKVIYENGFIDQQQCFDENGVIDECPVPGKG